MQSTYEYRDYENALYQQSQERQNNNEPPDKVTKWIVITIISLVGVWILYHI